MKKLALLLAFAAVVGCLSGCTEGVGPKNYIAPMTLTQDQEALVHLLTGAKNEILLFEYKTEGAYYKIEVWVELYEDGERTDHFLCLGIQDERGMVLNERLAIVLHHDDGLSWDVTTTQGMSTYSDPIYPAYLSGDFTVHTYGPTAQIAELKRGEEILLYTSSYSDKNMILASEIDDPQARLSSSSFTGFAIKCKFT